MFELNDFTDFEIKTYEMVYRDTPHSKGVSTGK
jgi:hypothetical protein